MKKGSDFQAFTGWVAPFLVCTGLLFASLTTSAQLMGTKTVGSGGDYATIAAAIADLNTQGVGGGGVTFNVDAGHTETTTAPLLITATGTSANPIVFQKNGSLANPLVTRTDGGSNNTTALGALGDAVIQINGGDYITIDGFELVAQQQGIEYGILTQKTATNGSQFVTIKNCNITMTKGTSGYVVGIYISNGSTSASSATGVTVTANSGRNESIVIAGNTISNIHAGILVRGYSSLAYHDQNITIGQTGLGNVIQNFGGGTAATTYGVYMIYVTNADVSYNTIDNAGGGGSNHGSTLYGIFNSTSSSAGVSVYNNNTITLSISATSAANCIYDAQTGTSKTFSSNILSYGTFNSTTTSYAIYASSTAPSVSVSGNQIKNFTKTGVGTFYCYYNAASPSSGAENIYNNDISNIILTGSSPFYGISTTIAGTNTQKIYNNNISNITGGTGIMYGIYTTTANTREINNNTISGFTGQGTMIGIYSGAGNNTTIFKNQVLSLNSSNSSTTAGTVCGIQIAGGNNIVFNNYISDLRAPASISDDAIRGINMSSTTTNTINKLYYNTVYFSANSSGANFGTSGIFHAGSSISTTAALELRNNIIVNTSIPNGTGITRAIRRSPANLENLRLDCNNNCYYAGTPGTNNWIYDNNTIGVSYQSITDYQTLVAPREALSFSELPPFMNKGTTPYDLHLSPSISTSCEGGGQVLAGYTDDFDGNPRDVATPDVGADEFNGIPNYTCATPAPGNTIASDNNICLGKSVLLTIQNIPAGTGLSYQWQSSTDGITYTDINTA
ncbi:MAG TPA: hypothetical protein P5338_12600, partial [Bacteroidales bacterium]|nr:hypothetical protein [Bacteroidales bacterium]